MREKWIYWQISLTRICCIVFVAVGVCVTERERGREKESEHSKQWTVQSDEADGNHSLDRQGREEVGEEEMVLAVKSATHRNNIFKPFSKTPLHRFCKAKSRESNYHGSAS